MHCRLDRQPANSPMLLTQASLCPVQHTATEHHLQPPNTHTATTSSPRYCALQQVVLFGSQPPTTTHPPTTNQPPYLTASCQTWQAHGWPGHSAALSCLHSGESHTLKQTLFKCVVCSKWVRKGFPSTPFTQSRKHVQTPCVQEAAGTRQRPSKRNAGTPTAATGSHQRQQPADPNITNKVAQQLRASQKVCMHACHTWQLLCFTGPNICSPPRILPRPHFP